MYPLFLEGRENWGPPLFILVKINVDGTLVVGFPNRGKRGGGLQCTGCIGDGGRGLLVTWFMLGTEGREAGSVRAKRSRRPNRTENVLESSSALYTK